MQHLQTNIYITKVCTRRCPECYYDKAKEDMSRLVAYDLAVWIAKLCKNEEVKQYRAHFLGGEPFNNYEVMCYFIEHLEDRLPVFTKGAKEGKYVIFTNGDLMPPSKLRRLKHWHVKLMLNPTYDELSTVEEKIKHIKRHMGGCSLAICLDDFNLKRIVELTKLAIKFKCHMRINKLYDGGLRPGYITKYYKAMDKVFDLLLDSDFVMWPNFILESTTVTWPGPKNPNFCGKYFLVFDPNGTIRSCNADLSTKVGSIYKSAPRMSEFSFLHRWSCKNLPECAGCEWATWCQGGCPYTRKLAYGTYDKKSPFCEVFKKLFPKLMQLKDRWTNTHDVGDFR